MRRKSPRCLQPAEQPIEPRVIPIGVSALGRLAPHGEVIKVAPVSGADGGRVDRLLVDVGDWVKPGRSWPFSTLIAAARPRCSRHRRRSASPGPSWRR